MSGHKRALSLILIGVLLVLCLVEGGWTLIPRLFDLAHVGLQDACREGPVWARWASGGFALLLALEILWWIRSRNHRPRWARAILGVTALTMLLTAVPAFMCLGPSTTWYDPTSTPPCWRRMCPRLSTFSAVLGLLQSSADVDTKSIQLYEHDISHTVYWNFKSAHEGSGVAYFVGEDYLAALRMYPKGVTLGTTVRRFGDPDFFSARGGLGEMPWRSVLLVYLNQGILVSGYDVGHWNPQGGRERLDEKTPVFRVTYFDSGATQESLAFLLNRDELMNLKGLQPWQGFGLVPYLTD